jgi:hypothetical protein
MLTSRREELSRSEVEFTPSLLALARAVEVDPLPANHDRTEAVSIQRKSSGFLLPLLAVLAGSLLFPEPVAGQAIRDLPGFKAQSVPRNDDGSGPFVALPFPINFFGRLRNGCWVNNNGNITFDRSLSTFTPFGLENTQTEIIAPFFADVDTRGARSQLVTFGEDTVNGRRAFGANYINVGYFSSYDDKLNSFQVILIDRSDTGSGNFDVEFNYSRIVWETGDASGGTGGFGGVPAAVGWSNGSGQPGTSFQLPGSLIVGAFLDSGSLALARRRLNSPVIGRYLFRAREGQLSPGLSITSSNLLPAGRIGSAYSTVLTADGGSAYQWSLLPDPGQNLPGLSLSPAGVLSGVPTAVGTYQFTARVTSRVDGVEESVAQRLTFEVLPATLQILSGTYPLPEATEGVGYRQVLRAAGAPGPYLWSWGENGVSPVAGLQLSEDGVLSGSPTVFGSFNFLLRVAGSPRSDVEPASRSCTLTVRPRLSQLTLAACPSEWGTQGVGYDELVQAGGGLMPYRWTALGALPPGVRLSDAGRLTGIPATTGRFVYALEVADAAGRSHRLTCNLTVGAPGLNLGTACPLPSVETGQAVRVNLQASGGVAPYHWSSVGTLPPGLSLSADGELRGAANAAGAYQFQLVARDREGLSVGKPCALSVRRAPLSISSCPLPPAQLGQSYEANLSVQGGVAPFVWTLSGAVPAGLTMTSDGRLSGVPTLPGTSTFTVAVRDGNGLVATQQCDQFVTPKPLRILGDCPLPTATVGSFYRAHALPDGGVPPYRFRAEGQLPGGLTLGSDGWFSGTPIEPRNGEVTIVVEDARRAAVRRTCALAASLPSLTDLRLTGAPPSAAPAGGALPIALQLDRPYPLPISGTLTLETQADTGVPDDRQNQPDPAVVFAANGRRHLNFSIPAGQRRFPATIAGPGTVAGYVSVSVSRLDIAGQSQSALPGAARVTVLRAAPVLTDACYAVTGGELALRLTGFSSTRDLTDIAVFLNGAEVKDLNVATYANDYFANELSIRTGGAFQIEVPIPVPPSASAVRVESLRVTLRNKAGASVERTARACN